MEHTQRNVISYLVWVSNIGSVIVVACGHLHSCLDQTGVLPEDCGPGFCKEYMRGDGFWWGLTSISASFSSDWVLWRNLTLMRMRAGRNLEQERELIGFEALWETGAIESQKAAASSPSGLVMALSGAAPGPWCLGHKGLSAARGFLPPLGCADG